MYAQIDSWHKVSAIDPSLTLCGRSIDEGDPTSETLPLDEKSCETCLRLAVHEAESPDSDAGDQATDPEDLE